MKRHILLCFSSLLCALPAAFPASAAYNSAPHAEGGFYQTVESVPIYGSVRVYDPEGDGLSLVVNAAPLKGSVRFEGCSFVYTPYPGAHGEDGFTISAKDSHGNLSNEAALAVSINTSRGLPAFRDMDRRPYEYSVIRLADAGVMSGEAIGSGQFFYPDREVPRGEFVMQLLAARGWDTDLPVCVNTGLQNDLDIPVWMKPSIRRAMDMGIVVETAFDVQSIPTRAEAVVLTDRAAQVEDVLQYNLLLEDRDLIPSWSLQSYYNLSAYRMLDLYNGRARPGDALNRDFAAALLWQLVQYGTSHS